MLNDWHKEPWLQFNHHIVRELAFSIASPPLLQQWPTSTFGRDIALPDAAFWLQHFKHYLPRLKQLDNDPTPLVQHLLLLRSPRLGLRFEALLAFWLQDTGHHPYQLLGKNLKRLEQQRTIGEVDFLLLNQETNQVEHWEVAVKFYLGEASLLPEQWLGLNRKDSLGRKLQHLANKQFNVESINQYEIQHRKAIIKGRLFYPLPLISKFPDWLAPNHLQGQWGYQIPPSNHQNIRYAYRHEWLCENSQFNQYSLSPTYWREGLYFLMEENQVKTHYMLRERNHLYKFKHN